METSQINLRLSKNKKEKEEKKKKIMYPYFELLMNIPIV